MPRDARYALNDRMGIDHVIKVMPGGGVVDPGREEGVWAPEVICFTTGDGSILKEHEDAMVSVLAGQGWEVMTYGYSGQYSYRGPIMHESEYIGGRLAADILERPGLYVACEVTCLMDVDNPLTEEQRRLEEMPGGWIVCRRDLPEAPPAPVIYLDDVLTAEELGDMMTERNHIRG